MESGRMPSAAEALERLREGNRRFVAGDVRFAGLVSAERRARLASGQRPFAAVLGCSDSRVPVEIVFDQGPGELFVIRVAGNVAAPSQIGSVEFAVEQFGTPLVVVLGHSGCGAVAATLERLRETAELPGRAVARRQRQDSGPAAPRGRTSPNLEAIVARIRPALEELLPEWGDDPTELHRRAVRANVLAAVRALRSGSGLLTRAERRRRVLIVGAEYSLTTGAVEFLPQGQAAP